MILLIDIPVNSLKIDIPITFSVECIHTCSNAFRIIKRIGKGSHGNVFKALHVPSMTIYGIKQIKCRHEAHETSCSALKQELKAMNDLCRPTLTNGGSDPPLTTLLPCKRCCNDEEFERIEGGIRVTKNVSTPPSAGTSILHSHKSSSMLEVLGHTLCPCPFVVKFFDACPDMNSEDECVVMEYMRWGSLQEHLTSGHCFSEGEIATIAYSILQALVYIDSHDYIHRDIKPGNILMDAGGHIKLADFGAACQGHCPGTTEVGHEPAIVGTLFYLPPESFATGHYTHKSDIWSLGVTLVHLMHGSHPFAGQRSYWTLRENITHANVENILHPPERTHSKELMDFLAACMNTCPEKRHTAAQLLQSPYMLTAIKTGAVLAGTLNARTESEQNELDVLASIISEEWVQQGDGLQQQSKNEHVQRIAEQIGVPAASLERAVAACEIPHREDNSDTYAVGCQQVQ